jgi:D-amino-acid oxidase
VAVAEAIVVGAGITGLTTAVRLREAGWSVRVLAERPPSGTTSWLAAAVWFPTRAGPRDRVLEWGRRAHEVMAGEAAAGVPGVLMRDSLMLFREPPGTPWWAGAVRGLRPAEPAELPAGYRYGLRFRVALAEMPAYLPWLLDRAERSGVASRQARVGALDELSGQADLVVNCSGLGARELAGDPSVVPVRGQIVRVRNPGLTLSVRDEQHPGGRAYVHPRVDDCILGGTLDEGVWDTEPDPATTEAILRRCRDLAPELAGAEVLAEVVGLRPARPSVRLERDPDRRWLIHNYGHGGAGITLGWGCADEVATLAGA